MQYRRLGRTNLQVSVLGVGGGYLSVLERSAGEHIYERAFELGVNYFDGRYGDSNVKLRPVLKRYRDRCVVSTKTHEPTYEGVIRRIDEELKEMDTDYLDIFLLRTYSHDELQRHLAAGSAFEATEKARREGKVRFVGLACHGDMTVLEAGIKTGLVDVVLFPLNIVRREALDSLIPLAQQHDVGLAVMKPVSVGMIPAEVALPWLMNQPIHTMVPGISSLEQLEQDVQAVERDPVVLSPAEEAEVARWQGALNNDVCRICKEHNPPCEDGACQIILKGEARQGRQWHITLSWLIHHDIWYNHYLNMGMDEFLEGPWANGSKKRLERHFSSRLELIKNCDRCGLCALRCPYHVPVLNKIERMLEDHPKLLAALREKAWSELPAEDSTYY